MYKDHLYIEKKILIICIKMIDVAECDGILQLVK